MLRKLMWGGATLMATLLALPGVAQAAEAVKRVTAACGGCGCC
jgi:hypothetical protein